MSKPACRSCTAPTDAVLCRNCTTQLDVALAKLPALVRELEVTATRQARLGDSTARVGRVEDEAAVVAEQAVPAALRSRIGRITLPATVLPVSLGPALLLRQAVTGILSWGDGSTVRGVCTNLRADLDRVRRRGDAAQIHARALDLVAAILATIDRRDPDEYAGPCQAPDVKVSSDGDRITATVDVCGKHLYAAPGETTVTCPACGHVYDVEDRKRWMLAQLPDVIAPTTAIANALTSLLEPVTPSMIRQMAYRGEIAQRGTTRHLVGDRFQETALYQIGDVIKVLRARAERKARKVSDRPRRVTA